MEEIIQPSCFDSFRNWPENLDVQPYGTSLKTVNFLYVHCPCSTARLPNGCIILYFIIFLFYNIILNYIILYYVILYYIIYHTFWIYVCIYIYNVPYIRYNIMTILAVTMIYPSACCDPYVGQEHEQDTWLFNQPQSTFKMSTFLYGGFSKSWVSINSWNIFGWFGVPSHFRKHPYVHVPNIIPCLYISIQHVCTCNGGKYYWGIMIIIMTRFNMPLIPHVYRVFEAPSLSILPMLWLHPIFGGEICVNNTTFQIKHTFGEIITPMIYHGCS